MKEGIYNIHKPVGPTSNDLVMKIKRLSGIKKVGHAGTLDPLAEGVLVVGVGREATRQLGQWSEKEKEYLAKIRLGINSTTDDEEGEKTGVAVKNIPDEEKIKKKLQKFEGKIRQMPPKFSAVKVSGQEAYKRMRAGEEFSLGGRDVEIKKIELLRYKWPILELKVITGPGVYIRSLARDAGKELKTGAYLKDLIRTRVGEYSIDDSIKLELNS